MTADEAYALAVSKEKELAAQQAERFFKEIEEAANNGLTSIPIGDGILYDEAAKAVQAKGFRLEFLWDMKWSIVWFPKPVYKSFEPIKPSFWQRLKRFFFFE